MGRETASGLFEKNTSTNTHQLSGRLWTMGAANSGRWIPGRHRRYGRADGAVRLQARRLLAELSAGSKPACSRILTVSRLLLARSPGHWARIARFRSRIEALDCYTYVHSVSVAFYSLFIAKWLGLPDGETALAFECGLLHDLGKTEIPARILKKAGPLTGDELELMKSHSTLGYRLLQQVPELDPDVKDAVLYHHERLDGSGYPSGVAPGNLYTRIVAIADVYDAMTSDRAYKKRDTPFKAFEFFLSDGASLFDQRILDVFLANMASVLRGAEVMLASGERGKVLVVHPGCPTRLLMRTGFGVVRLNGAACFVDPRFYGLKE